MQTSNVGLFSTVYLFCWLLLLYQVYIAKMLKALSIELATFAECYQNEMPWEEKCKR